jgi:hypothetical protein
MNKVTCVKCNTNFVNKLGAFRNIVYPDKEISTCVKCDKPATTTTSVTTYNSHNQASLKPSVTQKTHGVGDKVYFRVVGHPTIRKDINEAVITAVNMVNSYNPTYSISARIDGRTYTANYIQVDEIFVDQAGVTTKCKPIPHNILKECFAQGVSK